MSDLQLQRWRTKPFQHQVEGVRQLIAHESFGLFWEMGCGKSKAVVDAVCELKSQGRVDLALIITPASVRSVWVNPDFGEIKKHAWLPSYVIEYHTPIKMIWKDPNPDHLDWCVTNYEFIRNVKHREKLKGLMHGKKVMLVLDESSYVKNRQASQTKACVELGKLAARRVILNGTPVGNNPFDLWSQANFLSPRILPYKNFFHFRADYAVLGGWHNKQVINWRNLDKLQNYLAPYVTRREKKDCLDLPDKIYTQLEVPLSQETWDKYKQMRDEAVVYLEENPSMAAQAGVRVMRLSQITSGFLGGFIDDEDDGQPPVSPTQEVGREKLDLLTRWVSERLEENPGFKVIVWCRFRLELERVARELRKLLPTYRLYGGQKPAERQAAIKRFGDAGDKSPALLAGQVQAGGFGLNLVAADHVVYLSNTFSLLNRLQSEDRVHRPGQTNHVLYVDVIATGPKGQKTVDAHVVKALRAKSELANWTVQAWKQVLEEA